MPVGVVADVMGILKVAILLVGPARFGLKGRTAGVTPAPPATTTAR
jgi:hypothetical protein